jgi:adenylosuccinate synthase
MNISTLAVIGSQWGDEGKGKITDFLAEQADVVVRYQGGPNAGHTVVVGKETFKLHQLPSGIIHRGKICILGNGMVIDPVVMQAELKELLGRGLTEHKLFISDRVHLIMPYHKKLDELEEQARSGGKIGTTMRGIGPAYVDKISRLGLRAGDFQNEKELQAKVESILKIKNELFTKLYGVQGFTLENLEEEYLPAARRLVPYICDTSVLIDQEITKGSRVLFEGAQGTMLDIDYGTYPYVTSSNPVSGGICTGSGVAPSKVGTILGITKAYTTRVGEGPFPTELNNPIGDKIREKGREYGTTTGRPRRIGWLDGVALRHACRINGFGYLAITLFDVLSGMEKVKVASAYSHKDGMLEHFPANLHILDQCKPVYQEFKGWDDDISEVKNYQSLPEAAKSYINGLEEILKVKIALISVGPRRDQTIVLSDKFFQ